MRVLFKLHTICDEETRVLTNDLDAPAVPRRGDSFFLVPDCATSIDQVCWFSRGEALDCLVTLVPVEVTDRQLGELQDRGWLLAAEARSIAA